MTARDLKNSILQLAVQGKLVSQNDSDEPASALLKRIKAEKEKLIKDSKIKKEKPLPPISEDEIPFELPSTWVWVKFEYIGCFSSGYTPKTEHLSEKCGIPYFKISDMNVRGNEIYLQTTSQFLCIENPRSYLAGSIVYPKNGGAVYTNKRRILAKDSVVDLNTGVYTPYDKSTVPYLYLYFTFLDFKKYSIASPLPTLDMGAIRNILVPLPPLEEQKRIVAKIKELLPYIEEYGKAEELSTLNEEFPEKIRKSILQLAVQGKLVSQNDFDEPVSELLKRIAQEKQELDRENKQRKEVFQTISEADLTFELPPYWSAIRVGEAGIFKKGPFGSSLTKNIFVPKGNDTIKVYEQKNAIQKDYSLGEYYITYDYFKKKMMSFEVHSGDVIVSCAGTIGETYVLPDGIEKGIINQALMRMRIVKSINLDYFLLYFDYVLKSQANASSKGSAIRNIPPFDIFKNLILPLPPIEEQARIVARVEELLALCERLN